ncbi:hypothetical protein C8R43DRAFT_1236125, partial [Mycena crocata]
MREPHAKELLSLLSLLPDGISNEELLSREAVDIPNVGQCKAALLRTSLAYMEHGRLKALSPIREYTRRAYPPSPEAVERLRQRWDDLLAVWKTHKELPCEKLISRLRTNLANIDSLIQATLIQQLSGASRQRLMHSILRVDLFSQNILKRKSPLASHVVDHIQSSGDRRLHWERICSCLDLADYYSIVPSQADALIREGIQYFDKQDPSAQVEFYKTAAMYHYLTGNLLKALEYSQRGMTITKRQHIQKQLKTVDLQTNLRSTGVEYAILGKRVTEEQAESHWTMGKLRNTSDLCKLGRDILVTYGHEGSSREVNILDIEAGIRFEKSEYDEARALYEAVIRMTDQNRHPYFHSNALFNLVKIDLESGRDEVQILRGLTTAKETAFRLGWTQGMLFGERLMATVQLKLRGNTTMARKIYTLCFESARRANMFPAATHCLEMLADLTHEMCNLQDTFHWAGTYLALMGANKDIVHTYQALRCLGDIILAQGDTETASNIFHAVLEGSTDMDIHRRRADCMLRIGDLVMMEGDLLGARKMWEDARLLFLRSSQMKDVTS